MAGHSIARLLLLALVGLTIVLAAVAGLSVASLYDARQRYEEELAASYAAEVSTANLLASGVVEEAVLRSNRGGASPRAAAAAAYDRAALSAEAAAQADSRSARLVAQQIAAQAEARAAAARARTATRRGAAARDRRARTRRARARRARAVAAALREREAALDELTAALTAGRRQASALARRQAARRAEARERAGDDSTRATVTAGIAGGLALVAALALVSLLVAGLRRPLARLVGATRQLASGDLSTRVEPEGPTELRELSAAFNSMAGDLEAAQARVEAGRRRLAAVIESLNDALVICDAYGRIVQVNPRAGSLVPDLVPGRNVAKEPGPLPTLRAALDTEVEIAHGDRTLSVTAARMGPAREDGVVWTIRDVTERARLERAKSEFVATASHELRSPLTSIKGFVELLGNSDLSDRQREFLDIILLSTNRLVDLVSDLLDVARVEAGELEIQRRPIAVVEAVHEVVTLMGPRLADKRQELELDLAAALPAAYADPARIRQIITNLVTNAHLYTPEGGRITIRLGAVGDNVQLSVTDTGPGMTEEQLEHIFDRFYRGGRDGRDGDGRGGQPGTGLGLSIVRSLVELHEGEIDIESAPGHGTTVFVRLPRAPSAVDLSEPRMAIRGKRVLVVDDEPDVARLIAEQLRPHGVETECVHSGTEAIRRLQMGRFDAVTLDILLDDMDGFELLREIRDDVHLRGIPVIVVSVLARDEALAGEWSVSKPIDADELADAIGSAILAGRASVLVVGRPSMRDVVGPLLARRGIDHAWATSGAEAARLCEERHFEVAMVDAGMRSPQTALAQLDLRGRRLRRSVIVFSAGDDSPGLARLDAEPVPVEDATQAVVAALKSTAER